jgi:hypothetical protein
MQLNKTGSLLRRQGLDWMPPLRCCHTICFIRQFSSSNVDQPKACKGTSKVEQLGQPTLSTHPHLFAPAVQLSAPFGLANAADYAKQVTPFITKQELELRRHTYVDHLTAYQSFYLSSKLSKREKANKLAADANVANLKHQTPGADHSFIAIIPAANLSYMSPVSSSCNKKSEVFEKR